jgi:hypothetical protein
VEEGGADAEMATARASRALELHAPGRFIGVSSRRRSSGGPLRFIASASHAGKKHHIGTFESAAEAARAYDAWAVRHAGHELNFPVEHLKPRPPNSSSTAAARRGSSMLSLGSAAQAQPPAAGVALACPPKQDPRRIGRVLRARAPTDDELNAAFVAPQPLGGLPAAGSFCDFELPQELARLVDNDEQSEAELLDEIAAGKAMYWREVDGTTCVIEEDCTTFLTTCDVCARTLSTDKSWTRCLTCFDFDICTQCMARADSGAAAHATHVLVETHSGSRPRDADGDDSSGQPPAADVRPVEWTPTLDLALLDAVAKEGVHWQWVAVDLGVLASACEQRFIELMQRGAGAARSAAASLETGARPPPWHGWPGRYMGFRFTSGADAEVAAPAADAVESEAICAPCSVVGADVLLPEQGVVSFIADNMDWDLAACIENGDDVLSLVNRCAPGDPTWTALSRTAARFAAFPATLADAPPIGRMG